MVIVASAAGVARADGDHPPPRASLEIDPVPYFFRGYSVHATVVPIEHLRATIGVFGNHFVAQSIDNWDVRTPWAFVASVGGYLRDDARGFGLGIVGVHSHTELGILGQTTTYDATRLGPFVTFAWFPFYRLGFYVRPWIAGTVRVGESGSRTIGPQTYDDRSLGFILALHIGWEIGPPRDRLDVPNPSP
jgi:hypothetical protein